MVPIALALIKTQTSKVSDKLKFLFDFNLNWLPTSYNYATNNIKASLSPEEYQNVLKHINEYIEAVVTKQIKASEDDRAKREKVIDPTVAAYIATIIKQQIIEYKYVLSDEDVERIAEVVRSKLAVEFDERFKSFPITLSQENLEAISKVVKVNIESHSQEWAKAAKSEKLGAAPPASIDVDEILYKILTSSKLSDVIDQRIDGKISVFATNLENQRADEAAQIQNEINELKGKVGLLFTDNLETKASLEKLNLRQDELTIAIADLRNQNNANFEKFLTEVDVKLNGLNEKQFAAIDNHIRTVLVDILGYKSTDGKPIENVDITNWIRNVFVAKDLLEIRLNELNANYDQKLKDEINQSAGILIKDISEKIKHDITLAIEENNRQVYAGGKIEKNVSLDERRIRAIIREALAIYDADKTGMVDYALESSGGEVLSTR